VDSRFTCLGWNELRQVEVSEPWVI
jgi:hypothetical protein